MDKVRIGVIGLGGMGINHIGNIIEIDNIQLAAVCDSRRDVCDKIAEKHKAKAFYDSDEMMQSGEVDAVLIATPHFFHAELAVAAFESGLHVLSEKPIAVHKADAEAMISAHKKQPELKFAAMFQMRTSGVNLKIKQLIENGELGEIRRVNWVITDWFRPQAYYNAGSWRATWKGEGGGVLLNQSPHQLDLLQWFFGMPDKVRAFCTLGRYHNIEVEDDVTAYLEYKSGLNVVFITSTGEAPGTNRLEIVGDRGRLVLEDGKIHFKRSEVSIEQFINETKDPFGMPPMWDIDIPSGSEDASHRKIIENFSDAILNGSELIAEGEEGIKSVELSNAMLFSALNEETVCLPMGSNLFADKLTELINNSTFVKPATVAVEVNMESSFKK